MKLIRGKSKALLLDSKNRLYVYRVRKIQKNDSSCKKYSEILGECKLSREKQYKITTQKSYPEENTTVLLPLFLLMWQITLSGYVSRNIVSRTKELVILLYSALIKPQREHCDHFLGRVLARTLTSWCMSRCGWLGWRGTWNFAI